MTSSIQQLAWRHFTKKHSMALRPEVVAFLQERLQMVPEDQVGQVIEYIASGYMKKMAGQTGAVVELQALEDIIRQLFRSHRMQTEAIDPADHVNLVLDKYPMLSYEQEKDQFAYKLTVNDHLQERFKLAFERVSRHLKEHKVEWKLTPLKGCKACPVETRVYCFAMLVCTVDCGHRSYTLEDLDDLMPVEVEDQVFFDNLIFNGQFLIASGVMKSSEMGRNMLSIDQVFPVPADHRSSFLRMANVPCPLKSILNESETAKTVKELERRFCAEGTAYLACFAELWLDRPDIVDDFERAVNLLIANATVPSVLLLLGSHLSSPPDIVKHPYECFNAYKQAFKRLSVVLKRHPQLKSTRVIIAPGPNDPWSGLGAMPRKPLPSFLFEECVDGFEYVLSPDPVRLFWFSKEFVFTRDNVSCKLEQSCLSKNGGLDLTTQAKMDYLCGQGSLQPFLPDLQAVNEDDYGRLCLNPIPHLLVIAEPTSGECKQVEEGSSPQLCNPDRFAYTRTFLLYNLGENHAEVLRLP